MDHPLCKELHERGLSVLNFAKLPTVVNYFSRFMDETDINDLSFVGLMDDYRDGLKLFYNMFAIGKNPQKIDVHENRNFAKGNCEYAIGPKVRRKLEKINSDDMEIYELAIKRYNLLQGKYGDGY